MPQHCQSRRSLPESSLISGIYGKVIVGNWTHKRLDSAMFFVYNVNLGRTRVENNTPQFF